MEIEILFFIFLERVEIIICALIVFGARFAIVLN